MHPQPRQSITSPLLSAQAEAQGLASCVKARVYLGETFWVLKEKEIKEYEEYPDWQTPNHNTSRKAGKEGRKSPQRPA